MNALRLKPLNWIVLFIAMLAPAVALADAAAPTTAPIVAGQRIFVAGHSFHYYIASWLIDMAKDAKIDGQRIIGISFIGGSRVIQHWDVPAPRNDAKTALLAGQVDVLTLSPITLPDEGIEDFARLALAHNPSVRVTVQESWLPNDESFERAWPLKIAEHVDHNDETAARLHAIHDPYFRKFDDAITDVNKKIGQPVVLVVPCGHAVLALRENVIKHRVPMIKEQSELFFDALGHPTAPMQALVAYCHFAVIYRRSPVGLPIPTALMAAGYSDPKLNRLLQEIAWDACMHEPLSGVSPPAGATTQP